MLKLKNEFGYDYDRHATELIEEYLKNINSKGKGEYTVREGEYERVAEELRKNNGMLFEPIRIVKKD